MSQLYSQLLVTKGHGYPLYIPEPNENLPYEYRQRGISIGDVGIITSDGEFDFLFNVYLPATHPINENNAPKGFIPLELKQQDIFRKHYWYAPGTIISTGRLVSHGLNVESFKGLLHHSRGFRSPMGAAPERLFNPSALDVLGSDGDLSSTGTKTNIVPMRQLPFERGDGAFLILPEGATREDLLNVDKLRDHGSRNAAAYYNFANGRCGRMIDNNSLLLVTGCDKAKSWELASGPNTIPSGGVDHFFQWCLGSMQSRFGPIPPTNTENQCVFLRGLVLSLDGHVKSITSHNQLRDRAPQVNCTLPSQDPPRFTMAADTQTLQVFSTKVAIKQLVTTGVEQQTLEQRLKREIAIWRSLQHPNITTLLGIASVHLEVSQFMPRSGFPAYIGRHPELKMQKARKVASGVQYLHANTIVHGDLKADNVLVTDDSVAQINDFGMSRILNVQGFTTRIFRNIRFTAPELMPISEAREVTSGVQYLHANAIIHGDLKADNLLLTDNNVAQIADFGMSQIFNVQGFTTRIFRNIRFTAPELMPISEVLCDVQPTFKSDIFSLGTLFLRYSMGKKNCQRACHTIMSASRKTGRSRFEAGITQCLTDIGLCCACRDPSARPDVQ